MIEESRRKPMPGRLVLALALLIALSGVGLGSAMCAAGLSFARNYGALLLHGEETTAVVVGREIRRAVGRGGGWDHVLDYRFGVAGQTVDGAEAVNEATFNALAEGASVAVIYEPGMPTNHYLASEWGPLTWLGLPLVSLLFGMFVLGASGFAAVGTARALLGRRPLG